MTDVVCTRREAFVGLDIDVAGSELPMVSMLPGDWGPDRRLVSVTVMHPTVELSLTGSPEELRQWAQALVRLADDLAIEADELAYETDDLTAVDDGTEVEF